MSSEISKVLEMKANGEVTAEEAVQLIEAITKAQEPTNSKEDTREKANPNDMDSWSNLGKTIINKLGQSVQEAKNSAYVNDDNENTYNMSKVQDIVTDSGSRFSDNSVQVSSVSGIELSENSSVRDCSFNACKITDLTLIRSTIKDFSVNGSSLVDLDLIDSQLMDVSLNGTSLRDLQLSSGNKWSDVTFHGSSVKKSEFQDCIFKDMTMNAVRIVNCVIKNVEIGDRSLNNISLKNLTINSTEEFLSHVGS